MLKLSFKFPFEQHKQNDTPGTVFRLRLTVSWCNETVTVLVTSNILNGFKFGIGIGVGKSSFTVFDVQNSGDVNQIWYDLMLGKGHNCTTSLRQMLSFRPVDEASSLEWSSPCLQIVASWQKTTRRYYSTLCSQVIIQTCVQNVLHTPLQSFLGDWFHCELIWPVQALQNR